MPLVCPEQDFIEYKLRNYTPRIIIPEDTKASMPILHLRGANQKFICHTHQCKIVFMYIKEKPPNLYNLRHFLL